MGFLICFHFENRFRAVYVAVATLPRLYTYERVRGTVTRKSTPLVLSFRYVSLYIYILYTFVKFAFPSSDDFSGPSFVFIRLLPCYYYRSRGTRPLFSTSRAKVSPIKKRRLKNRPVPDEDYNAIVIFLTHTHILSTWSIRVYIEVHWRPFGETNENVFAAESSAYARHVR